MTDPVEEAYKKSQEKINHGHVEIDGFVSNELRREIKDIHGQVDIQFAQLTANPYLAPELVDDFRRSLTKLIAVLIENDIPLQHSGKPRTAEDIMMESLGELAGMVGAKGAATILKMKRGFKNTMDNMSDEFEIFQDPDTGEHYYIDPETGEEVDCDEYGNPLED